MIFKIFFQNNFRDFLYISARVRVNVKTDGLFGVRRLDENKIFSPKNL